MQQQQPESPQLFNGDATEPVQGYVRQRLRKPTRAMTSLELSAEERQVLGEIAKRRGSTIASVLREGLAMVAAHEAEKAAARNATRGERLAA